MTGYLATFAAGFLGSFHCIGMCGGFACALGRDPRGVLATAERHLLYNLGRLTTYCFLGASAGALGQVVAMATPLLDMTQRLLAVAAGSLMIAMALQFFGLLPGRHGPAVGLGGSALAASLRSLLATRNRAAPVALGVLNGFLPCPLVYAFVALAASAAAPLPGFLVMLAFGLGTFPAMLATGGIARALAPAWRERGVRLAGAGILLLGAVTIARGVLPVSHGGAHAGHEHPATTAHPG